ncbi:hypothetical protein [Actinotalea sp. Marseille-Q4924]|uniref:hypothetical protein n=1 Tax=Actinotalea sp. Marseille-Q4924 TaxID=2866571 RepID=UPI001CE40B99|nr:hypothetical protein [Actinotalea sp. Marseille-Q4924]
MATAAELDTTAVTARQGLAAAALDLARSGPVAVVTEDDDATARVTSELVGAAHGTRVEGVRTTTSPVVRRAVLDRVALGQVDVLVVSAGAWDPARLPDLPVVDARAAAAPVPGRRYVLCRLGAR